MQKAGPVHNQLIRQVSQQSDQHSKSHEQCEVTVKEDSQDPG